MLETIHILRENFQQNNKADYILRKIEVFPLSTERFLNELRLNKEG